MKIILSESQYNILMNEGIQTVSLQGVKDNDFIYPVYHGTSEESYQNIIQNGFRIPKGSKDSLKKHGFDLREYYDGIPAPTDFLGFGIYFTTVKSEGKKYNDAGYWQGKKVLPEYALKADSLETINFGSPKTMMKWWISNGYDVELAKRALKEYDPSLRDEATEKMTEVLKSKYDAVLYRGAAFRRENNLDGNQICVFDTNNIFLVDKKGAQRGEIGSKVVLSDGRKGTILDIVPINQGYIDYISNPKNMDNLTPKAQEDVEKILKGDRKYYEVKLTKGGKINNLLNVDFEYL